MPRIKLPNAYFSKIQLSTILLLFNTYSVTCQKARGDSGGVTVPSPNPTFKNTSNLPKILSKNIPKHFADQCRSIEPHIASSIRRFSLYGFLMLLQYNWIIE